MLIRFCFQDDDRCPGCDLTWGLYPPAKIHGQKSMYRCVECKRVYQFDCIEVKEGKS